MRNEATLTALENELQRNCGDELAACQAVGVSLKFVTQWRKDDPKVNEILAEAARLGTQGLVSAAIKRAVHGVEEDVYFKGEVVGQKTVYSDGLLTTLLKGKIPEFQKDSDGSNVNVQVNIANIGHNGGPPLLWEPQPGPQSLAVAAQFVTELMFGGARGGGKSDYLLGDYLQDIDIGPEWAGIIFRKSYPELEELIKRAKVMYAPYGAIYKVADKTFVFPSGATLKMRHVDTETTATSTKATNTPGSAGTNLRTGRTSTRTRSSRRACVTAPSRSRISVFVVPRTPAASATMP
jgi:hypothetical protein